MKRLLLLYTIIFSINLVIVIGVVKYVNSLKINNEDLVAYYNYSGFNKGFTSELSTVESANTAASAEIDKVINQNYKFNYFSSIGNNTSDYIGITKPIFINNFADKIDLYTETDLTKIQVDQDMIYTTSFKELPLHPSDYYYHKFTNAVAGVKQLNTMPIMSSGTSIGVIRNLYLNIRPQYGYVSPPHYVYGSGVCWTTSALGAMLDDANANFKKKYGLDLFIYYPGDRAPHGGYYLTYTNNHRGYTVLQRGTGLPAQDYRININPKLGSIAELRDIKIKIIMLYSSKHPKGSYGESIAAYIVTNKDF